MLDVCVVGSANLDLVATTGRLPRPGETVHGDSYHEYPGGKGLNQAVAAARSGADVAFVGAVGADDAGRYLLATANASNVDTTGVTVDDERQTGRAIISVDRQAENCIVVVPGANGRRSVPRIPSARVVLAQLRRQRIELRPVRSRGRLRAGLLYVGPGFAGAAVERCRILLHVRYLLCRECKRATAVARRKAGVHPFAGGPDEVAAVGARQLEHSRAATLAA